MKRAVAVVFIFAVYLFAAGEVRAFEIGAGAGVYIPSADVKDLDFPVGYSVNAHIDQGIFPMLSLRLSGDYSGASFKKYGYTHEFSTYGGALLLVFSPPIPVLDIYAGAGYNAHWFEYNKNTPLETDKESDFGHGIVMQAGVGISVFIVNIGINAQYYVAEGDFDAGGFTVGLGAGLSF